MRSPCTCYRRLLHTRSSGQLTQFSDSVDHPTDAEGDVNIDSWFGLFHYECGLPIIQSHAICRPRIFFKHRRADSIFASLRPSRNRHSHYLLVPRPRHQTAQQASNPPGQHVGSPGSRLVRFFCRHRRRLRPCTQIIRDRVDRRARTHAAQRRPGCVRFCQQHPRLPEVPPTTSCRPPGATQHLELLKRRHARPRTSSTRFLVMNHPPNNWWKTSSALISPTFCARTRTTRIGATNRIRNNHPEITSAPSPSSSAFRSRFGIAHPA